MTWLVFGSPLKLREVDFEVEIKCPYRVSLRYRFELTNLMSMDQDLFDLKTSNQSTFYLMNLILDSKQNPEVPQSKNQWMVFQISFFLYSNKNIVGKLFLYFQRSFLHHSIKYQLGKVEQLCPSVQ